MLVFPEGRKGTEKLYKDRYQLRRFGRGGFVEAAMRAQGADRAGRGRRRRGGDAGLRPAQRAAEAHRASSTSRSPRPSRTSGCSASSATCRRSSSIRFLEPIPTDQWGDEPWDDRGLVQTVADEIRAPHPGGALRHARQAHARSGSDEGPRHRPVELLGRPARPGARARPRGRGDHRRLARGPDAASSSAPSTSASAPSTRCCAGSSQAAEIDTVVDTRLIVDSTIASAARRPRGERDRDDEHPRRLLRARLAGAQVRLQVDRALLRLRAGRPGFFTEGMQRPHPPRTRLERDIVEAEKAVAHVRGAQPGRSPSPRCASSTASGPT